LKAATFANKPSVSACTPPPPLRVRRCARVGTRALLTPLSAAMASVYDPQPPATRRGGAAVVDRTLIIVVRPFAGRLGWPVAPKGDTLVVSPTTPAHHITSSRRAAGVGGGAFIRLPVVACWRCVRAFAEVFGGVGRA
jgi:hypothetical protein